MYAFSAIRHFLIFPKLNQTLQIAGETGARCASNESKLGEVCTSSAQCESVKAKCRSEKHGSGNIRNIKRCKCLNPQARIDKGKEYMNDFFLKEISIFLGE